ncbi:SufD family Fe-S cluster assembly protein [Candidatus Bandiella euplotis]|uniref:SufD family Fe-S cluster assembly protein n=1 Tax=Candidatus Bandiella euplotis TaxID=1664265 RepID=UPI002B25E683|nr:SufD family Fe-S cluster assembly protein [Candidatus Bandiella woodruffii]
MATIKKPTKRNEDWRYSNLKLLDIVLKEKSMVQPLAIPPFDDAFYLIVFVDGKLQEEWSNLPKKGVELSNVEEELKKLRFEDGFDSKYQVLQNYSKMECEFVINLTLTLEKPLKIWHLYKTHHTSNTFVKIGDGVDITIYEEFVRGEDFTNNVNQVTKIELGKEAGCKHFKKHDLINNSNFIYTSEVICNKNARYNNYVAHHGHSSYRQETECSLQGDGAMANFHGIIIGNNKENYDIIIKVKHKSSHTKSFQHYNQIFNDQSSGAFYTKVEILEQLSNVEAHQLNKNLLLNDEARVFFRPELDICSDDVVCSHGATVGNIDENALYYLMSRGIDIDIAKQLLLQGFLSSVFENQNLSEEEYEAFLLEISKKARNTSDEHEECTRVRDKTQTPKHDDTNF